MFNKYKVLHPLRCMILTLWLLTLLTACNRSAELEIQEVAAAKLEQPMPKATGQVILTISGAITTKNEGESLVFDIGTLEKLPLVKYTVHDPWLDEAVTYTGILMSDFLKFAGVPESATTVNIHALDEYEVDIPITEVEEWPILLATQNNGQYMAIENNGPTRIIYPYDSYPNLNFAKSMSIWNIDRITVK